MTSNAKMLAVVCAGLACLSAVAAEGTWTEAFGQGNFEYSIDSEGVRLTIGCPTSKGSARVPSSVTVQDLQAQRDAKKFVLEAGGTRFEGPFEANGRAGQQNFVKLLEALRKGDAVLRVDGRVVKLPRANAASVIPAHDKQFPCNLS